MLKKLNVRNMEMMHGHLKSNGFHGTKALL